MNPLVPPPQVRTLVWVHKTRLLGHYKIFHHYIERCPCRPSSPLSRSYARSYSRALTGIGPRPCLRAPLSLLGLQGLFIRTPPSADAWAGLSLSSGGPAGMGLGLGQGRAGEAGAPNAYLVEIFRLQPFAAAAYLRSLLYCWIGGVMLQLEAAASFGVVADGPGTFYERTAWHWLCLQLTLQFLQAPARLQLWHRLVRVSHSQEAEASERCVCVCASAPTRSCAHVCLPAPTSTPEANSPTSLPSFDLEPSDSIRRLVTSHLWIFSQALGTLFHIVAAFGPVFLHLIEPGSPVRRSVLAVCCANLLVFVVRSALTYIIVISILDARNGGGGGPGRKLKRGLSRESLLRLRRVESDGPCADGDSAAAGPGMCSICLAQFEAGESLVLLPCDERHAFHEDCITQVSMAWRNMAWHGMVRKHPSATTLSLPHSSTPPFPSRSRPSVHSHAPQWLIKSAQCPLCMGDVAVPKTPQPGPGPAVGPRRAPAVGLVARALGLGPTSALRPRPRLWP